MFLKSMTAALLMPDIVHISKFERARRGRPAPGGGTKSSPSKFLSLGSTPKLINSYILLPKIEDQGS